MDPDACFDRILTKLNDGDYAEASESYVDLLSWIGGGGFKPKMLREDDELDRQFFLGFTALRHYVLTRGVTP